MVQLLTDRPSTQTVQAPHWLVSQPTWVPVSRSFSRRRSTSSVRGSTSAWTGLPLTVRERGMPIADLLERFLECRES